MPFGGSPHEGRLSAAGIGDVHVGAVKRQHTHGFDTARASRNHQRGLAIPPRRVRRRAALQQSLSELRVAVRRGERERRFAVFVGCIRLRAGVEQRFGHTALPQMHGPGKRRCAVRAGGVYVGLCLQERIEGFVVAALNGLEEAQIALFGGDGDREHEDDSGNRSAKADPHQWTPHPFAPRPLAPRPL